MTRRVLAPGASAARRLARVVAAGLTLAVAAGLALPFAAPALAQGSDGDPPTDEGRELFEVRCAVCHGEDGRGAFDVFPRLSGNENLADLATIVTILGQGGNLMPPFADLTADQIAAIATYVRSAWENDFGAVTVPDVVALQDAAARSDDPAAPTATMRTIWDGVFSAAQAERGGALYEAPCGRCHGRRLDGASDDPDMRSSPPLARAAFLRRWDGRSLATLYEYIRATMPESTPGSLPDQEYIDLIAYMLATSGAEPGEEELMPDPVSLAGVRIEQAR
ncbi:MAG TPA: c-type cytochrome [Longimicrobiales bacterium]|nr:c-type cytochrome [Longimicrobiales bacterium]